MLFFFVKTLGIYLLLCIFCKKARGWLSKRVIHPKLKRKNNGSQKPEYREKTMRHLKPNMKHMCFEMHYDEWKKTCELHSECRLCTQQCNAKGFDSWKLCNTHDILSLLLYFAGLLFFFYFILKSTDWLSLPKRCDDSCNLILSFFYSCNQSIEILIVGFVPFFLFKNFDYSAQQGNIRLRDWLREPLKDDNELLHFGIWPSETFLI